MGVCPITPIAAAPHYYTYTNQPAAKGRKQTQEEDTIMNRSKLFAAAAAISAAGFLPFAAPAQALPMFPLAPACSQWGFPGDYFDFYTTKDYKVSVNSKGQTLGPSAVTFFRFSGTNGVYGNASGSISGTAINLNVNWSDGSPGQYVGTIDPNGVPHGYVLNGGADWKSDAPLTCVTSAPPNGPETPPGGPAAPATATVVGEDVDVYDVPGGNGNVIGILRVNNQVQLVGTCKPQDWCEVQGAAVPTGKGWVWGHLQF
jgi:hypothetical protein